MKLSFLDFWDGFDINNNFFLHSIKLLTEVDVVSPEEADLIIFSCFGDKNFRYMNKRRIFYTGENLRPNFDSFYPIPQRVFQVAKSDYALTFDFSDDARNIRLPLWMLQIDWFGKTNYTNPQFTISPDLIDINRYSETTKDKFCCIMFNKPSPHRLETIDLLSRYKKVDVYGSIYNNVGYGEDTKLEVISQYRFNICYENSIHPGYYTEKPLHAKIAGCIPVYWSDEKMSNDFNNKAFINLRDFNDDISKMVQYIISIDEDESSYTKLKSEKLFSKNQNPNQVFNQFLQNLKSIL